MTVEWTLGDRLRKSRETAGLSQQEMADRIDVSRNSVGNWENDRHAPLGPMLTAWAQATGVDREWLEHGDSPCGEPAPPRRGIFRRRRRKRHTVTGSSDSHPPIPGPRSSLSEQHRKKAAA